MQPVDVFVSINITLLHPTIKNKIPIQQKNQVTDGMTPLYFDGKYN